MKTRLYLFSYFIFAFSIFAASVNGAERPAQQQPQIFTNQDIEKYGGPSDIKPENTKTVLQEERKESLKDKKKRASEEHGMEVWCKKATTCNRRIENEKEEIKEIENKIIEAKTKGPYGHKKGASLDKRLESAKKRLKKAEGDLNTLEDEAHRKGVKPGWLRCQT